MKVRKLPHVARATRCVDSLVVVPFFLDSISQVALVDKAHQMSSYN